MKKSMLMSAKGWFGLAVCCAGLAAVQAAGEAEVKEFIAKIKSEQGSVRVEAIMKAGPLGAAAVAPLAEVANGQNRDASLAALTALKNVAAYAGRPGAAEEKKAVGQALTQLLDGNNTKVVRCLALELLSVTGDEAVAPNVAALLGERDPDVRDEAKRCLQGIPGAASTRALLGALDKADPSFKVALLTALGQRAAPEAAEAFIAATGSSDMEVVLAALDGLARLGVAKDDRISLPDWEQLNDRQRNQLGASFIRWADQRVAKGAVEDALEVYHSIYERGQPEHLVCAVLIGAAKAVPERVGEFLVQALGHEQNTVRATAAQILEGMSPDETKIGLLMDAYRGAKPDSRDLILRVLKAWNDKNSGS